MASATILPTPGAIVVAGATVATVPYRVTPELGRIVIAGNTAIAGPGTGFDLSVATPDLNTQKRQVPIGVVRNGMVYVTEQEMLRQQRQIEAIEAAFTALTTQVSGNTILLNRIALAQELAQAANDNATTTTARLNIESSYPSPPNVLSASNTGVVTITAHSRVYADGTEVSVNAGSVSGFANGATVTVYYVDAAREGGAVAFQGTTMAVAQANNTHVVGTIVIPAAGQPASSGTPVTAPGVSPDFYEAYEGYNPRY